jgi:hypothetical protein
MYQAQSSLPWGPSSRDDAQTQAKKNEKKILAQLAGDQKKPKPKSKPKTAR